MHAPAWRSICGSCVLAMLPVCTWAQQRLPIIDMHLHARKADYIGTQPPPMCTPFTHMPRWDPDRPDRREHDVS